MHLVFYTAPMSSATPVATALTELEVPHERVVFDLQRQDNRKPDFLKLNPNGKVPTLVVDGTPMFEALAIMQWLGDRFGVERGLWPAFDAPARLQALSWTTWAYVTYVSAITRFYQATGERSPAELHNAAQGERTRKELGEYLDILEQRLGEHPYLLGDTFSLADLIVAGVVGYGTFCGVETKGHARVSAWLEACQSRPSFKKEWT